MAGSPQKRAAIQSAESAAAEAVAKLNAMRAALIAAGLDPEQFDTTSHDTAPALADYHHSLPREIGRLAGLGHSLEEIRIILGYTEAQEEDWRGRYVGFSNAIDRARAQEQGFWLAQVRAAAKGGDRSSLGAITALIDKRFHSNKAAGNAAALVSVRIGGRLVQPEAEHAQSIDTTAEIANNSDKNGV